MTRGPSLDPESGLNTPHDEYPTYPLRARTTDGTNTLFAPDRMKTRTEATLVASTSASASPLKPLPLARKHTTKELINLYESASNTHTSYSNSDGVLTASAAYGVPVQSSKLNLNAQLPELPQSKPLRKSFKDLLTMFGKKRATKQKHAKHRSMSPSTGRPQPRASYPALGAMSEVVLPSRMVGSVGPAPTTNFASPSVSSPSHIAHRQFNLGRD
jgi:hypothetical protein